MEARELFALVKNRAGLRSAREAERAIRAALGSLACALAEDDAHALSMALPEGLRRPLVRSAQRVIDTADELFAEVERRERVGRGFAREHTQAVLEVIASALEADLVQRIRKHLPDDLAALLETRERGGEPPAAVHVHPARAPRPMQTLSRARPGTAEPIGETRHPLAHAGSVARTGAAHSERMIETAHSTRPAREDETLATAREDGRRRIP